jgi:hypothetical protein
MMTTTDAATKLTAWQTAHAELVALEMRLGDALWNYERTRLESPRALLIEVERKRQQVHELFELAVLALDAQSAEKTGHTNFGEMR